jgi:hypothetical protein
MPIHSHLAFRPKFLACFLCNEEVALETTKIDESGKPVHEECYVQQVCGHKAARPPTPIRGDPDHKEKPITQELTQFFDTEACRPVDGFCPICGSQLECRAVKFFYENRTWKIHLTNCVKCKGIDMPN